MMSTAEDRSKPRCSGTPHPQRQLGTGLGIAVGRVADIGQASRPTPSGSSIASDATPNTFSLWWISSLPEGSDSRSLTEGLHTDGPMGTAMLTIMAAFAQLERDTMIERTRAGLLAAAANGRKGGRPRKVDDADAAKARKLRDKGIAATTSRKCWESPAPPFTATFPMVSRFSA